MNTGKNRFKLTQFDIYDNAEEGPGCYGLFTENDRLLYLAYSENLPQSLMKHLPVNERNSEIRGKAKLFAIYPCKNQDDFIGIFDEITESRGELPAVHSCIPEGSKYAGKEKATAEYEIDVLVAKARAEFQKDNVDEAFRLMSSHRKSGEGIAEFHLFFGQLLAVRGFEEAIKQFEKAVEKDPMSQSGMQAAALAERCSDLLVGFKKF
jgi:tetratricopeptide (TPR) repeat protein